MDYLLELIQMALGNRGSLSGIPTQAQWEEILTESRLHAIEGFLFDAVGRLPSEQKPPQQIIHRWLTLTMKVETLSSINAKRSAELISMFSNIPEPKVGDLLWSQPKVRSIILKGQSIAQLYPNPSRRLSGDIDIWLVPKDSENDQSPTAINTLFRKQIMAWFHENKMAVKHYCYHHVEVDFFPDIPVEVHFHPTWTWNPIHNANLQRFFFAQAGSQQPTTLFHSIVCLVHTYRHLLAKGVGIRHIVDYYFIVKQLIEEHQNKVVFQRILRQIGLRKFAAGMMWVLHYKLGMPEDCLLCEPNQREGLFLWNEVLVSGNFGHKTKNHNRKILNNIRLYTVMITHYPGEIIWMPLWKVWQKLWIRSQQ